MIDPARPTCATCPHWDRTDMDDGDGLCCRHAPRPVTRARGSIDNDSAYVYWPITLDDEGCGEHPDFPAFVAARKESP